MDERRVLSAVPCRFAKTRRPPLEPMGHIFVLLDVKTCSKLDGIASPIPLGTASRPSTCVVITRRGASRDSQIGLTPATKALLNTAMGRGRSMLSFL